MNWLSRALSAVGIEAAVPASPQALGESVTFSDLNDPALRLFLSGGTEASSGAIVNDTNALRNTSVLRCVTLISNAIGRLPLHLLDGNAGANADKKAVQHPLFKVLHRKPNDFQTAFEFRRLLQRQALVYGNGYALPIRSSRGQIVALMPIVPGRVRVTQAEDWSVTYHVRSAPNGTGVEVKYSSREIFHLRGMSACGLVGDSLVRQANEAIGLALMAERAAASLFRNGSFVGGVLGLPAGKTLSVDGAHKLRTQFEDRTQGASNSGKWVVAEDGLSVTPLGMTGRDAQHLETRKHQIEEIARVFGVPRPFLMIDDTSWGTGIEQLGIYLVQHCLAPWFEAWEQAIWRTLLTDAEQDRYQAKFNESALLRGSTKDQAEYLRKLVGTGQDPRIIEPNEARGFLDMGEHPDGSGLKSEMMSASGEA